METTKEVCNHASEIKKMPPQTDPYINGEHSDFTEVVSHRWDYSVKNRGNLYHLQNNLTLWKDLGTPFSFLTMKIKTVILR